MEQDPEDLWRAVVIVLRSIVTRARPRSAGDGAGAIVARGHHGACGCGGGSGTCNAISWMDGRAQAEYEELRRQYGGEVFCHKTGWPLMAWLPLQHIRWLHDQQADVFARSQRFLFVNDFIGRRLTGELSMNPSDASITSFWILRRATGMIGC